MSDEVHKTVDRVARDSRARLLAFLAARTHDIAAGEDALADAFHAALETWPRDGVPNNPEAWLLTAARRRLIDAARHDHVHHVASSRLEYALELAQLDAREPDVFPDERLKLLFVCAHPAIDASSRTPLMLQTVLGLDAKRIASAFLVKPATMGQRLSRAKTKIRDATIAFEVPQSSELPGRLDAVLEAIYAAYGSGWEDIAGADMRRKGLAREALQLGTLLVSLLPNEPEAMGLAALMLYCESRREARRSDVGKYIPLSEQDPTRWSLSMIERAEKLLRDAGRAGRVGRFQLEAAIQSAHATRARTGHTDWDSVALLYEGLVRIAPTIGAQVGRAAAVAEARNPVTGWVLLQKIPERDVSSYQPYWALAAHLLGCMGRREEASSARERAIGLCEDEAMRAFLINKCD